MKTKIVFIAMGFGLMLIACDPYKKTAFYGNEELLTVTGIADAVANERIEVLEVGQTIRVGGTDLHTVKKVFFNDLEVPMSTVTALKSALYLKVPRIPRGEKNRMILISTKGVVEVPIQVKYPPFKLNSLLCEWVPSGDTLILVGESTDIWAKVGVSKVKISDGTTAIETPVVKVTDSEIMAIVPDNAPSKATVSFLTDGLEETICPTKFRDVEFLIDNFEIGQPATRYPEFVVPNVIYPLPLFPIPIEGERYAHVRNSALTGTLNMVGNYNVAIPEKYFTIEADDMELKFEMYTVLPMAYRAALSLNQGGAWIGLGPTNQITDPALMFSTRGRWITMTFSMGTWKNKTGAKNLRMWLTLPSSGLQYDVCFDNFRIQKKGNK